MSDAMSDASEEQEGQGDQQEPTMEEILASIRRIISEDGEPMDEEGAEPAEAAAEPEPEPEPEPPAEEEDILELTDVVEEEPAENEEIAVVDEVEPEPEPEPAPEPMPEPEPVAAAETYTAEGLVSPTTADATTGAFAGMTSALHVTRGLPLGNNQTLEGIVKELLRPMLKEWLDENLAPMVQRIVEREVAKLAGRAEDDETKL